MFPERRDNGSSSALQRDRDVSADRALLVFEPLGEDGVLKMKSCGTWGDIDVHRYFAESEHEVKKVRALAPTLRFLGDLRDAQIDVDEAGERVSKNMQRLFRPGDRVALVVRSSLEKARLRQTVNCERVNFFLSVDSARMWLDAAA
jgi:hypothetical protein